MLVTANMQRYIIIRTSSRSSVPVSVYTKVAIQCKLPSQWAPASQWPINNATVNTNRILERCLHACHATLSVCGIRYERLLRSHVFCVPWHRYTPLVCTNTNVNYVFDIHEIRLNGLLRELTPNSDLHAIYLILSVGVQRKLLGIIAT